MKAKTADYYEQMAFRNYMADGLMILTENTASSREKHVLTMRFTDLLHGKTPEPEKDAQTIINELRAAIEEAG